MGSVHYLRSLVLRACVAGTGFEPVVFSAWRQLMRLLKSASIRTRKMAVGAGFEPARGDSAWYTMSFAFSGQPDYTKPVSWSSPPRQDGTSANFVTLQFCYKYSIKLLHYQISKELFLRERMESNQRTSVNSRLLCHSATLPCMNVLLYDNLHKEVHIYPILFLPFPNFYNDHFQKN